MPPNASTVRPTARWQSSTLVTSPAAATARPPPRSISSTTSRSRSSRRAIMHTSIPARAHATAVARPIPLDAPLMQIALPRRSILPIRIR